MNLPQKEIPLLNLDKVLANSKDQTRSHTTTNASLKQKVKS
jgi:hypothetical protein